MHNLLNLFIARNIKKNLASHEVKIPIHINKNILKKFSSLIQKVDLPD